ncbi:MAG TPA: PP2C family protein-serine/threonine phosphatase [Actinomycetospora sp.]|uniref:PP2C family protein-serine/threonine phosphatase n=1 Tax=Actinomycetospora sp. TaxID=1872135 RepID=UPI002F42D728
MRPDSGTPGTSGRPEGEFDAMPVEAFDEVSAMAAQLAEAPLALVCEVGGNRAVWRGVAGMHPQDAPGLETPVMDSVCGLVVAADDPVVVADTAAHPASADLGVVAEMGIGAWAGFAVRADGGRAVAVLMVIDTRPRTWDAQRLALVERLSTSVALEWRLRVDLVRRERRARADLDALDVRARAAETEALDSERRARDSEERAAESDRRAQRTREDLRATREWAHRSLAAADARTSRAHELADAARRQADAAAEMAEVLQQSLVPMHPPRVPGVEIAARHRSPSDARVGSGEVLGDFYDVFATPTGWGVVVGDVCGHGAQAARTTALARSTVRALGHSESDPSVVLSALNGVLHDWFGEERSFVTAAYAVVSVDDERDGGRMTARIASAGHPPVFLHRPGLGASAVDELRGGGRILGILPDALVEEETVTLEPGSALVLYTDGILEARPPGSIEQFGEEGVAKALAPVGAATSADGLADVLLEASGAHAQRHVEDDALVLVVRRPGAPTDG